MTSPRFLLQIVDPQEKGSPVVRLPGGGELELDLVKACADESVTRAVDAIRARGVGFGRTEAHVLQVVQDEMPRAIRDGMAEAIRALKRKTTSVA